MDSSPAFCIRDFSTLDTSLLSLEDTEETGATIPRSYQMEMFQKAMSGNVIAVLDTGSGKTLISCLIIKHMHNLDFEKKQSKISVFVYIFTNCSWYQRFRWFRSSQSILASI
jgi:replicative superfamily II helicase